MRIVVTGHTGQVAMSLVERGRAHPDLEVVTLGRPEIDLLDPSTIGPAIAAAGADVVVSAAAYTAVDAAEDDRETAYATNLRGAEAVAAAAARIGAPVIHLSTDYVFDGRKQSPYVESDPTNPLSVYGASKLAGEAAVAAANPRHLIVRTAWVYSPFGRNFVRTMLKLAETRDEVRVVSDQLGNPSSALDIADGIILAARRLVDGTVATGIYHLAGSGETNWSGFASHIFEASRRRGRPAAVVREIVSAEYPARAQRPMNSRLDCSAFAAAFGWAMPDWRTSAETVVNRLAE